MLLSSRSWAAAAAAQVAVAVARCLDTQWRPLLGDMAAPTCGSTGPVAAGILSRQLIAIFRSPAPAWVLLHCCGCCYSRGIPSRYCFLAVVDNLPQVPPEKYEKLTAILTKASWGTAWHPVPMQQLMRC